MANSVWSPAIPQQIFAYQGQQLTATPITLTVNYFDPSSLPFFNYKVVSETGYEILGENWVTPASITAANLPGTVGLSWQNGMSYNITPIFQNLNTLSSGIHVFYLKIKIQASTSNGQYVSISEYTYSYIVKVPQVQDWAPTTAQNYTYNIGDSLPAAVPITLKIKDVIGNATFSAYSQFRLKGLTVFQTTNTPVQWLNPSCYENKGYPTNNSTIPCINNMQFGFTPIFQNFQSLAVGSYVFKHQFAIAGFNSSNVWVEDIAVFEYATNLTVTNVEPPFGYLPTSLIFTHSQYQVRPSVALEMKGLLWEVTFKPNFIVTSDATNANITTFYNANGNYQIASGSGTAILNITTSKFYHKEPPFLSTDLTGNFTVKKSGVFYGNLPFIVNVINTSGLLVNPYEYDKKAFTLEPLFFEFKSTNVGTYFQFDVNIKVFQFFSSIYKEIIVPQKLILFKNYSKINIGQLLHRLMARFDEANENEQQYKLSIASISFSEINLTSETIVRSGTFEDISFVAGLPTPNRNLAFLNINQKPNRVTIKSFVILNVLIPVGAYEIKVLRNGFLDKIIPLLNVQDVILTKKVYFNTYTQGDIIDFILQQQGITDNSNPRKRYHIIPSGNFSNMIVWEDEYLLQSALECTGEYSVKSDFEFLTQKKVADLVEILETISTSKEVKLTINTGWIIETDIDTVESLMRSKKAWLILPSSNINIRPIAKTLINKDSDRALIDFNLEFIINKKYNEETYSF